MADWLPDQVGYVTGVVGAAGGLGGVFPPLVVGFVVMAGWRWPACLPAGGTRSAGDRALRMGGGRPGPPGAPSAESGG